MSFEVLFMASSKAVSRLLQKHDLHLLYIYSIVCLFYLFTKFGQSRFLENYLINQIP
jgi:hypothetical protein